MSRCELIAELATNHAGDLSLAKDMIAAAAEAGADWVKTQGFQVKHLRRDDPQYGWFQKCELSPEQHAELKAYTEQCGAKYLSTGYHREDLDLLKQLGLTAVKIGSGEGMTDLPLTAAQIFGRVFVTTAWGGINPWYDGVRSSVVCWLSTVPIYPAPPETYIRCERQDGYSDHHAGITIAKLAIAQGAKVLEKHFALPECPANRQAPHNMGPKELKDLRHWADECAVALNGTRYSDRWTA